eukprot:1099351-Rhodomonas_salina.2
MRAHPHALHSAHPELRRAPPAQPASNPTRSDWSSIPHLTCAHQLPSRVVSRGTHHSEQAQHSTDRQLGPERHPDQRVLPQVERAQPREVAEAGRDVAELVALQVEAEQRFQRAQPTRQALDAVVACLAKPHPLVSARARVVAARARSVLTWSESSFVQRANQLGSSVRRFEATLRVVRPPRPLTACGSCCSPLPSTLRSCSVDRVPSHGGHTVTSVRQLRRSLRSAGYPATHCGMWFRPAPTANLNSSDRTPSEGGGSEMETPSSPSHTGTTRQRQLFSFWAPCSPPPLRVRTCRINTHNPVTVCLHASTLSETTVVDIGVLALRTMAHPLLDDHAGLVQQPGRQRQLAREQRLGASERQTSQGRERLEARRC